MAFDEELADRVRDGLAGESNVTERKMFGGLGFMVAGNMAVAASSQRQLMVRVDPDEADVLIETAGVQRMVMRGRELAGWVLVEPEVVAGDQALQEWVARGVDYVRGLPPK